MLERHRGLVSLALFYQRQSEIVVSLHTAGLAYQSLSIGLDGFAHQALFFEDGAQIVVHVRTARADAQCPPIRLLGLGELAELFVDIAHVGQGLNVFGFCGDGALIRGERFFGPSSPLQHDAEIEPVERLIGMLLNRATDQLARKVELADAVREKAQRMQRLRVFGAQLENEPVAPFGFLQAPGLMV